MSEKNERMLENTEEIAENAPKKEAPKKKHRKKRKKGRMPVQLCLALVVLALVFGIVVGYAVGRATGSARLVAAEQRINDLAAATEESGRQEIDIFTDSISAENREALADLSGMSMQTGGESNAFLADDGFDTEAAETTPEVVAEFTGGQLMSDEVSRAYSEKLAEYIFAGYTEEQVAESLMGEVMQELVLDRVLEAKARELGLYEITEADAAQIAAEAQAEYDAQIAQYSSFVAAEGMTADQITAAAAEFLKTTEDTDLESIRASIEQEYWMRKLRDYVVKDVQADNAEDLALAQSAAFDAQAAEWLAAVNPQYYPEKMQ